MYIDNEHQTHEQADASAKEESLDEHLHVAR
jgi:hypothetical protein